MYHILGGNNMKQTLEELALNILIEGKFDFLPIKISHLAKVNKVDYLNNFEQGKFENCVTICEFILKGENLDADRSHAEHLASLVMAPKCVLKACKVSSAENLHVLTALPIKIATQVYNCLNDKASSICASEKEEQIVSQFKSFIYSQLEEKPHFERP